jgi:hypothetical protein
MSNVTNLYDSESQLKHFGASWKSRMTGSKVMTNNVFFMFVLTLTLTVDLYQ